MEDIGSGAHERLSNLTDEQWGNILLKLRLHAEHVVQKKAWKAPGGMLPKGFDANDLASESVRRLLTGSRKWDPQKEPDVLKVLKGTVDSIADSLVKAPEHEKGPRFGHPDDDAAVAASSALAPDPHAELETKEATENLEGWIWSRLKDEEEEEIVLCIGEGIEKPAEIDEELGRPVERIYQVLRNMKRRLSGERKEMSHPRKEGLR